VIATRYRILVLLSGAIALAAGRADAFLTEGVAWSNATTNFEYVFSPANAPLSSAIYAAMQEWNAVTAFRFVPVQGSADPCDSRQPNAVAFTATLCPDPNNPTLVEAYGASTLAVTFYQTRGGGALTHAGIIFNQNKTFSVYDGRMQDFAIDIQRVATHEFGHVLGLDHEMDSSIPAIMAPSVSNVDRPTADDIAGVASIYGAVSPGQTTMVSAVLPASRSVQVNTAATAFATIVNAGSQAGTGCSIGLASAISANFTYQTTSAATNQPIGAQNSPVNIPVNGSQSFVISVTPTAFLSPTNVAFAMQCSNAPAASSTIGLNTLLLSASNAPTPDIVALAATAQNDGYVHIGPGSGAFALATVNLGAAGTLTVSADTGTTSLPALSLTLCQTNPSTGQCISAIGPSVQSVINTNETPTFSIFVNSTAAISPDPANRRIFVRFRDSGGATRGSTSVAVTSQ
jgi:predicted Zn-dependent protease